MFNIVNPLQSCKLIFIQIYRILFEHLASLYKDVHHISLITLVIDVIA